MTAYNKHIKNAVKSIKNPIDGFIVDIVEYDSARPPFIMLQIYYSQWITFNDTERVKCLQYLNKIKKIIESFGLMVGIDPILDNGKINNE